MKLRNCLFSLFTVMCFIAFSGSLSSCSEKDDDEKQEQIDVIVNIDVAEGKLALRPLINWDATVADVNEHMEKYFSSDVIVQNDGKIIHDTLMVEYYLKSYIIEDYNMSVIFFFNDSEGKEYHSNQFIYYGSNDIKQLKDELLRLGFSYLGFECVDEANGDNWYYLSPDKKSIGQIIIWNGYSAWSLIFSSYDENDLKDLIKD